MQINAAVQMMKSLYAQAAFPAILTDASLRICWCNQSAVQQISLLQDEAGQYLWPACLQQESILREVKAGRSITFPVQGSVNELFFSPVMENGALGMCQVLGAKIEELPHAAVRQVSQKLIGMSEKDRRMPLTIIFSTLGLLMRETREDKNMTRYLRLIWQNGYRLMRAIDSMDELARLWLVREPMNSNPADLARFICGLCDAVSVQTEEIGIPFSYEPPQRPVITTFDQVRLRRAFLNLISNACRYTREGNHIVVRMETTDMYVTVTVSDHGAGMTQETVHSLMTQDMLHMPDSADFAGNGVGLALVKTIVERHGGTLTIDSRLGEGTSVAFSLPIRHTDRPPDILAQGGAHYLKNRFSDVYVELSDVCSAPLP